MKRLLVRLRQPRREKLEVTWPAKPDWTLQLPAVAHAGQTVHLIAGFEAGANDYLSKPFDKREMIARVNTHRGCQGFRWWVCLTRTSIQRGDTRHLVVVRIQVTAIGQHAPPDQAKAVTKAGPSQLFTAIHGSQSFDYCGLGEGHQALPRPGITTRGGAAGRSGRR